MFQRTISPLIKRYREIYPIVGISGPRQSGKTTLAKTLFSDLPYVLLENLDTRERALSDPRGFLAQFPQGAIFDEVQNTPDLLSYLQGIVDETPEKGRFVLTGSQHFALSTQISQSLAGRIGMTTLLPLSLEELEHKLPTNNHIFMGGYPGLHSIKMQPTEFFPSYIQTYLERDIRQFKNIENLGKFQTFIRLCAGRVGQVVNLTSLGNDCGISHTTARQWLDILEASYLIFFLQPYHQNFSKRLIKMPKLYFHDTGLACSLLGLESVSQLETHYLKGALFENMVISELLKMRYNQGKQAHLYFWRDQTGHEVDVIAEWGGQTHAIEIKYSATFQPDFLKNVNYLRSLSPKIRGCLIYQGKESGTFGENRLLPLKELNSSQFAP